MKMLITDLDGTLAGSDRAVSPANRACLEELGRKGVLRVVATGRSLYSALQVLEPEFPIDYLAFSAGAGIMEWGKRRIVAARHLEPEQTRSAASALLEAEADFMIHREIPRSHHFFYYGDGAGNPDFLRRLEIYREFAEPGPPETPEIEACQLVAVLSPEMTGLFASLAKSLPGLKVIRSTSPLDRASTWLEVYHPEVAKSAAAEWIAARHGVRREETAGVGNDYNDLDLLEWVGNPFVVANAPEDLRKRFPGVASNDEGGFPDSVRIAFA